MEFKKKCRYQRYIDPSGIGSVPFKQGKGFESYGWKKYGWKKKPIKGGQLDSSADHSTYITVIRHITKKNCWY